MPSKNLNLTAQIIVSHASMRELTPKVLIMAIKGLYAALVSLDAEDIVPETKPAVTQQRKPRKVKMKESPLAKAVEDEEKLPVGDPDYMEFMESREG